MRATLWKEGVLLDEMSVLQGKLEGCTVNSHGVIRNHTTYYLNLDAHSLGCCNPF